MNTPRPDHLPRASARSWSIANLPLPVAPLLVLAVLLLTVSFTPLIGCAVDSAASEDATPFATNEDGAPKEEEAVPVAAFPLQRGPIERVLRYSSNLEAERSVAVLAEASRQVTELLVEEGSWVEKGQPLLRLEDEAQKSELAKTQSQLAKATREYQRQERLFSQQLISEQAFSESTYDKEQLEIAVADAERELGYATVYAPISGAITQRLVNLGDHIQVNEHLFDIVDFGSLVARIFVPEKELADLSRGQAARLHAQAIGGEARDAKILRIAPTVDSRSGTVKVTLAIPNKKSLRPGMFVEVDLIADTDEDALLIPKRALIYDESQIFVFKAAPTSAGAVADAGANAREATVERLLIETVIESRNFVKVTGEKLTAGDLVIVAGQAGLKDGAKVRLLDLQEALDTFGGGATAEELAAELVN